MSTAREERLAALARGARGVLAELEELQVPWIAPQEAPAAPRSARALREARVGEGTAPSWPSIPALEAADIAAIRQSSGLTQSELGALLGISVERVGKLERGVFWPTRLERQVLDHLRLALQGIVNGDDRRSWCAGVAELAARQGPVLGILLITTAAARATPGGSPPLPPAAEREREP